MPRARNRSRPPRLTTDYLGAGDRTIGSFGAPAPEPGGSPYDLPPFPPVTPAELPDSDWARWHRARIGTFG